MRNQNQISVSRRRFLHYAGIAAALGRTAWGDEPKFDRDGIRERIEGMLIGSLIGDAVGGPVEFGNPDELTEWLPAARRWPSDEQLTAKRIAEVANSFSLLPYAELRPEPAPYAHWTRNADPGTVTDDTRHKIPLLDAFRKAFSTGSLPISRRDLAAAYVNFPKSERIRSRPHYHELCDEGMKQYLLAARWVLGERDPKLAAPAERLWGGVATNAGQMALLPLAGALAAEPNAAYRAAFALGFMDNGSAKDINSAIVAGLAAAIGGGKQEDSWAHVERTMKTVDPFGYSQIPFVGRPVTRWLETASELAKRANAFPARLYQLLESQGRPEFYWDAHFILVSAFAILKLCDYDPLCSLQLALDFGHDTDSSAQLVGAFVGAIHGPSVFPEAARKQIALRLRKDYDEELPDWVTLLTTLSNRRRYPKIVVA